VEVSIYLFILFINFHLIICYCYSKRKVASEFQAAQWSLYVVPAQSKQRKKDSANCGVYVSQFLARLVQGNLDMVFTDKNTKEALNEIRNTMSDELKAFGKKSPDVDNSYSQLDVLML